MYLKVHIISIYTISCQFILGNTLSFEEATLLKNNQLRSLHVGTPLMTWDKELADFAQNWCEHLARTNTLDHSNWRARPDEAGENLYKIKEQIPLRISELENLGAEATQSWYDEIKDYKYKNPKFDRRTGHFTQVVWAESTKLGCGWGQGLQGGMNTYVVCCEYSPPGNFIGEFADWVMPLKPKRYATVPPATPKSAVTPSPNATSRPKPGSKGHVPSDPKNGKMKYDCEGDVCMATYTCDPCFELSGGLSKALCKNEFECDGAERFCTFSGDASVCKMKNLGNYCEETSGCSFGCPKIEPPVYGSVSAHTGATGETVSYACDDGYQLSGDNERTCLETGAWSGTGATVCLNRSNRNDCVIAEFEAKLKSCGKGRKGLVKVGRAAPFVIEFRYRFTNPCSEDNDLTYHIWMDGADGTSKNKKVNVKGASGDSPGSLTNWLDKGQRYSSTIECVEVGTQTLKFSAWVVGRNTKVVTECQIKCVD